MSDQPTIAVHARNGQSVKVYKYDSRALRHRTVFWADWGMINVLNEHTGNSNRIPIDTFLGSLSSLHGVLKSTANRPDYADERTDLARLCDCMERVLKDAIEQGDVRIDEVARQKAHDTRKIQVPVSGGFARPRGRLEVQQIRRGEAAPTLTPRTLVLG